MYGSFVGGSSRACPGRVNTTLTVRNPGPKALDAAGLESPTLTRVRWDEPDESTPCPDDRPRRRRTVVHSRIAWRSADVQSPAGRRSLLPYSVHGGALPGVSVAHDVHGHHAGRTRDQSAHPVGSGAHAPQARLGRLDVLRAVLVRPRARGPRRHGAGCALYVSEPPATGHRGPQLGLARSDGPIRSESAGARARDSAGVSAGIPWGTRFRFSRIRAS